jgi:hypothetical protein
MSFSAEMFARLAWNWNSGALDNDKLTYGKLFADGSGANQAEAIWHLESQEILDAATVTHDLTALTRTILGETLTSTLLLVKAILIVNESTSGGQIIVGGAGTNEWSEAFGADGDQVVVPLDSPMLLSNRRCGWEVDDTHKNLKLAASGGDVTYSIAIIGTTTVTTGECSSSGL